MKQSYILVSDHNCAIIIKEKFKILTLPQVKMIDNPNAVMKSKALDTALE
jgi:hypothetical protein